MSPFGGRTKASSPNPHDISSLRGEGMHSSPITPPSAARVKSMSSSPGTGGWKSRNDSSSFPPRGAESDTFRSRALGGGPVYPQWLASDGGNVMDLSDPFPSMWCCALFLHVHPKKQVSNGAHRGMPRETFHFGHPASRLGVTIRPNIGPACVCCNRRV